MMLGNLTTTEIEKRLGINFPTEIKDYMDKNHQPEAANVAPGKWHCFDIPFSIVFGDMETARKVFESVKEKSAECKEPLRFSVQTGGGVTP